MKYLIPILILLSLTSCGDVEKRRGIIGENCSGAGDDCREELICTAGKCAPSDSDAITCDQVCAKFAECGARESGCESDCRITSQNWDDPVQDTFNACLLNADCFDIGEEVAPLICYKELAMSDYEKERCDEEWRYCDLGTSFRKDCYRLAKVGSQSQFQSFDECTQAANDNMSCDRQQACLDSASFF